MKPNKIILMIRPVLTEILSIIIGVLLALAVNEWNENRIQTEKANEAIQNIIHEIDSNIKLMVIVNKNNKAVIELLKHESDASNDNNHQFLPGLQIQDTAWKLFNQQVFLSLSSTLHFTHYLIFTHFKRFIKNWGTI